MEKKICYDLMDEHLRELGLDGVNCCDIIEIIDGHRGAGYGLTSQEELSKQIIAIYKLIKYALYITVRRSGLHITLLYQMHNVIHV